MALSKQLIIDTAFEVLNEYGYEGLSTRRLAKALGVSGPSLYWHYKTQRELFNEMAEVMLSKASGPIGNPPSDFDYLDWLAQGMRNLRREVLLVRDSSMIFVGYQMTKQRAAQGPPSTQLVLARIGLELYECQKILRITKRFVTGWTLEEQTKGEEATPEELDEQFEFAMGVNLRGIEAVVSEWLAAKKATKAKVG
jgi:TetR/AcrR family tetracycline transcriptional repressor